MAFANPIVGGQGALVRPAIKSPDFKTGESGWSINRDGTAEFNNLRLRGTSSGFGNETLLVGPENGPQVAIYTESDPDPYGLISLRPNPARYISPAAITAGYLNLGANNEFTQLALYGPSMNGPTSGSRIRVQLNSQNWDGSSQANFSVATTEGASVTLLMTADRNTGVTVYKNLTMRPGTKIVADTVESTTVKATTVDAHRVIARNIHSGTCQTPAPGGSGGQTSAIVIFADPMPSVPRVVATANTTSGNLNSTNIRWAITDVTVNGFTLNCYRTTDFATNFDYIAIADT